jgi:thiol:disulfide interchange protein
MGAIAGNILPAVAVSALGVSMYAMFIAIVVPVARDSRPVACLTLISIGLSALFYYLPALDVIPDGFVIIIIAIACSLLFALIAPIKDETEGERNSAKQDSNTDTKAIKETDVSDENKEGSKTDVSEANDATEAEASADNGKEADSL